MVTTAALSLGEVRASEGRCPTLLLLALFFIGVLTLSAAATPFEGKTVSSIVFDPVNQPLESQELARVIPFKTGDKLSASAVRSAIEALYATGRYADIAVDVSGAPDNSVAVRFQTELNYFIGRVSVEGASDPPNPGQVVTASKLQIGTLYSAGDLRQSIEDIQSRMRANGLFKATVAPQTTLEPRIEQVNIDYRIAPGPRARFDGVKIEGAPERPIESILRSTRWRRLLVGPWKPLTESRLQSGIENVRSSYQKQDRLLAKVVLSALDYNDETNRVTPTLAIDAGPVVKVRAQGAKLSRGKLRQLLPIYQERSVDRSLLMEGRRNIVEYFQSQGYFDVSADFDALPVENGSQTILYTINRDQRHKMVALDIEGNRYFNNDTIRERMYVTPATWLRFRHGRYSQRYLDRDISAIEDLYQSNGFREVKVTANVDDDHKGVVGNIGVGIRVAEGSQWFVDGLQLDGVTEEDRDYLLSVIHSQPGQPFSDANVANDRDTILTYYFNRGYPDATFDWTEKTVEGQTRVNLHFTVNPGRRVFVRDVITGGLQTTNQGLVTNRIRFGPGDPLSQARIFDTQRRLYDLGIFAKVQTALQNPDGNEDRKYVLYQMEEARRYSFTTGFGAEVARIGGGVTSFDAPAGAPGFAPRVSLGLSRINFLGLGHTVSVQTRFSTLQQRALFSYYAPQFQSSERLNLTFSTLFDNSRDVRTFAARRVEGSVQLGQKLSRANTVQYRFTYRDVFVDQNSVKITPQLIPILSQSVRVGLLSTTFIQDRRDDPLDARRGVYNTVDLGVSTKAFGSQSSFGRALVRNATYHRISRDLTFARTTTFGVIDRFGGLPEIPLPERFFSGGSTSHRGFPDNQAGPRDMTTGFPLGGTALLLNSLELRFPLIGDNLTGVFFHDAGNLYASVRDISFRVRQRDLADFNYMVHAAGFGIRYRTPVGPIRVDLALSPNSPRFRGFQGSREDLLTCAPPTGPVTCTTVNQRINVFQFHFSLGQAF